MDQSNFDRFIADFRAEQDGIRATKGREYVDREPDKAAGNLRRAGRRLGVSPKLVWAVYAGKHFDALVASASPEGSPEPSESIRGRFLDLATYCLIGAALWYEDDIHRQGEERLLKKIGPNMALKSAPREILQGARECICKVPPSKLTMPVYKGDGHYEEQVKEHLAMRVPQADEEICPLKNQEF